MNDEQKKWEIIQGDALKVLGGFAPNTFDAVITDPPYASGGRTQSEKNQSTAKKYSSMGENAPPPFEGDAKELLRKGLDDGTERLRTQFRDTAQQGQRDEYGGDAVEDTAAGAVRRAEKLLRKRGEHTERRTAPEGENAPGPRSGTTSYHAGRTRGTSALYSSSQQNRAEEVYVRRAAGPKTGEAHTGKWPTGGNAEQGRRAFIRERGRKTAQRRLRDRRDILWYRNGGAQTGDTLYGEDDSHPAGRIKERDMSSHCISGSIKIAKMLSNAGAVKIWTC